MMNNVEQKDWPDPQKYRKSFRVEFSIFIGLMILIMMITTGYFFTSQYVNTVRLSVAENMLVQARSYSGSAGKLIFSANGPDELLLNNICQNLKKDNEEVYWCGISGRDSIFIAHTDLNQVIQGNHSPEIQPRKFREVLQNGEAAEIVGDTLFITVPIKENGLVIGQLSVANSTARIQNAISKSIMTVIYTTMIILFVGIPLTMVILNRKLAPIRVIIDNLKKVNFEKPNINIPIKGTNEFGYLTATIEVMGEKLNLAQRDLIEKERISRELEIAHEIQNNLLPSKFPESRQFEVNASYTSALEVGGDYYDFIEYGSNKIGFLVADVSGKSLPGMLVMLLTRDIIRKYSATITNPAELLVKTNYELLENVKKGTFITMFYGILDTDAGALKFASAGHNPLIHISGKDGTIKEIKTKGYPLGMMPTAQFENRIETGLLDLSANDILVQYTDGINEAVNVSGAEYGMKRFREALGNLDNKTSSEIIDQVMNSHRSFVGEASQFDDITLMAIKWYGINADNNNRNQKNDCTRIEHSPA